MQVRNLSTWYNTFIRYMRNSPNEGPEFPFPENNGYENRTSMEDTEKSKDRPGNGEPFLFHMSENAQVSISGS